MKLEIRKYKAIPTFTELICECGGNISKIIGFFSNYHKCGKCGTKFKNLICDFPFYNKSATNELINKTEVNYKTISK